MANEVWTSFYTFIAHLNFFSSEANFVHFFFLFFDCGSMYFRCVPVDSSICSMCIFSSYPYYGIWMNRHLQLIMLWGRKNIPSILLRFLVEALSVIKLKLTGEKQTSLITGTSFLICGFASYCFSYLRSAVIWKYWTEHSRSKSFINLLNWCTTLSSVRDPCHESCSVLSRWTGISLCPEHPTIRDTGALGYHISFRSLRGLTLTGSFCFT